MSGVIRKADIIVTEDNNFSLALLTGFIHHTSYLYPSFNRWFYHTVTPALHTNTRTLLVASIDDAPAGIAILKHDGLEDKLSTLFVCTQYRGLGVAEKLVDATMIKLNSDRVFFTVTPENDAAVSPVLMAKGFTLHSEIPNLYRQGVNELVYKA